MTDHINQKHPVGPAIECLSAYPPNETTDPDVTHLAHYLGNTLLSRGEDYTIDARGFVMLADIVVSDLKRGRDEFTAKVISDHPLTGREPDVYDKLYAALPRLAEDGFSSQFGLAVRCQLHNMGMYGAPQEATLDATEIITEPITNIDTARTKIVEDSRLRVLAHDWQGLGVQPILAEDEYTYAYTSGLRLRQSLVKSPVNLLTAKAENDLAIVSALPKDRIHELGPGKWLALTSEVVSPDYATAIRDLLYREMVVAVANSAGLNGENISLSFAKDVHGPLYRAVTRFSEFSVQHPYILGSH